MIPISCDTKCCIHCHHYRTTIQSDECLFALSDLTHLTWRGLHSISPDKTSTRLTRLVEKVREKAIGRPGDCGSTWRISPHPMRSTEYFTSLLRRSSVIHKLPVELRLVLNICCQLYEIKQTWPKVEKFPAIGAKQEVCQFKSQRPEH